MSETEGRVIGVSGPFRDLAVMALVLVVMLVVSLARGSRVAPVMKVESRAAQGNMVAKKEPVRGGEGGLSVVWMMAEAEAGRSEALQGLDAASRDRARADERAAGAERAVQVASLEVAVRQQRLKGLEGKLRLVGRDQLAKNDQLVDQLGREVRVMEGMLEEVTSEPKPRKRPLVDQTPVAQVVDGQEYHFEVHRGRVAFIDLDRLIGLAKSDAELQVRLAGVSSGGMGPILSSVGPVGGFTLRYELGRSMPGSIREMLDNPRSVSFGLTGWEVVPVRDGRGDALERAFQPLSDFSRVLNTLDPGRSTITLWIYPDSFAIYRDLRDWLHQRGFMVAARPLPEGVPIQGSPRGSMSAGQ